MKILIQSNPSLASQIAARLLADPAKAQQIIADALVTSSCLLATVNATGGLVRNAQDEFAPAINPVWVDLSAAIYGAQELLRKAGVAETVNESESVDPVPTTKV